MEPLKEMFNKKFYEVLAREISRAHKDFNATKFISEVISDIDELALNQRLRRTTEVLKKHLPGDFKKTLTIFKKVIPNLQPGYTTLVFPDYVGKYGKHDIDTSLEALKYFTKFGSSEFAVREFLKADFNKTLRTMKQWAKDKDHHVRRLASEGSRPRLPWSFKLDKVIENPKLTLPILELLKEDKELYVRKSVANHLNDISKEHPKLILDIVKNWKGSSPHTDWILKHASRNLLKQGHTEILSHFGIIHNPAIEIINFKLKNTAINVGEDIAFSFSLHNRSTKKIKVRLEYAVYFRMSNGNLTKKVFKISEREIDKHQTVRFERRHSFKLITTRRYHPGSHKVALIVNGMEGKPYEFKLGVL
jgi:3-methyladenine DNA glycosylase AlkC